MLEMQIISPKEHQRFPDIVWNFDELKTGIESAMADYKNLVVVPESEREFKDTRAKLNKLYQAIETARKSMKEKVMEPLVKFEGEVKQVEAPIVECIDNIDTQLKEIDQIRKDRKRGEIFETFEEYVIDHPDFPEMNRALGEIGEQYGVPKTAVAIAWILRHPARMQAIAGTMNPQHLRDICAAAKVRLTHQEWYRLYLAAGKFLP